MRLPVIDITNPRFAVPEQGPELDALAQAFYREERRQRIVPAFIMRWLLKSAAEKSRLFRALFASDTGYLDAISTYVMKLGADNLPPGYDSPMDRRFAASPHVALLRLRMSQMARLQTSVLEVPLAADRERPLVLVNIAGGPALDSLNTLILLKQAQPDLLDRPIRVIVLDLEPVGPVFGANALDALTADGCPLSGLAATFVHHSYDWNEPSMLGQLAAQLSGENAIVAVSSEGGLFEYGSDEAIIDNLQALRPYDRCILFVTGSVTKDDETRRRMILNSGLKIVPRGLAAFRPLAEKAGWTIASSQSSFLSDQVLLRRC